MATIEPSVLGEQKPVMYEAWLVYDGARQNAIFDAQSNPDGLKDKWIALRERFAEYGINLVTADLASSRNPIFVLYLNVQPTLRKIASPAYAILFETPQVHPLNAVPERMSGFRKIFTWDDAHVDGKRWIKCNLGQRFLLPDADGFSNRTVFCSMIAANKALAVNSNLDLYLERQKLIRWFEQNAPDDFALYGADWDLPACRPGTLGKIRHRLARQFLPRRKGHYFPSWRGRINAKNEALKISRYTIAYENVRDLPGYITEKIFDAFSFGCIPVYWGASNVGHYIPETCFIDRRNFRNNEELYYYLKSVREAEYVDKQCAIRDFCASPAAQPFSAKNFADTLAETILADLKVLSCAI